MKTVQMTIDQALLKNVDRASRKLRTTRSAFTRDALRAALRRLHDLELEQRHRQGYREHPSGREEFGGWDKEQIWPPR